MRNIGKAIENGDINYMSRLSNRFPTCSEPFPHLAMRATNMLPSSTALPKNLSTKINFNQVCLTQFGQAKPEVCEKMRKVQTIIAIIFIAINIQAQESGDKTSSENAESNRAIKTYLNSPKHSEKTKPVTVPKLKAESSIVIDGNPDEAAWQNAATLKDFIQTEPGDNIAPSKPTEAYLMYDEKHLYVAFKAWDDRDKIRATVAKRDDVFNDDNVRIYFDTYDDQRRAYLLAFNPLGIQHDGILSDNGPDFSVDIVMESKGMIHDWGWSVEVKIPFKSLRYKAGKGNMWGMNAARNISRLNNEFDSWMPLDRDVQGFIQKFGKITGLNEISSERTLEIVPSITVSETGRRVPDNQIPEGRFVNEPVKQDLSLNLKYTITPNITLDAAINPDFAEIEADAPVVTANERFPIFFEEKRPFFLEGADTFRSPLQIFNSRTIIDPDVAAKLTGKVGKNSFGFLVASDNAPGNYDENDINDPTVRPFIDEFIDKNATFAVLRVKRDFGRENNIGFFGTARTFPENKNFVGGLDGTIKVNPSTTFNFQAALTNSKKCFFDPFFDDLANPNQAVRNEEICGGNTFNRYRIGNGFGYYANYSNQTETKGYFFRAIGRSKDYRADAGFTPRTDEHRFYGVIRRTSKTKPNNRIINAEWRAFGGTWHGGDGRLQEAQSNTVVIFNLQKNTNFSVNTGISHTKIYEDEFGLARNNNRDGRFFGENSRSTTSNWIGSGFNSNPIKRVSFSLFARYDWNTFDFDFGAGNKFPRISPAAISGDDRLDPGSGGQIYFTGDVTLTPTDPLKISFNYRKTRLVRNDTERVAFDSNIYSLKTTYNFTRFIFARARIDYNTLRSNVSGQYLLGWNPSPGKGFYVGYNDNSNYNGYNPYTSQPENGFQRNERTFFMRVSYLFRRSF